MSQINWNNLRSWNGSQQSAFEELCCQLANYESIANRVKFYRKGAPDAGVECFWVLEDSKEIAWQAKFFLAPPTSSQWSQIDESVKVALKKHPELSTYIVCLPIDRPDPRIKNQESFTDKWNARVKKWKEWAQKLEMKVDFDFWGNYEIGERLSREDHRGRYLFWFNTNHLSKDWLAGRLSEAVADAGPRYTPELNIDLPISFSFLSQALSRAYFDRLLELYGKYLENLNSCLGWYQKHLSVEKLKPIDDIKVRFTMWIEEIKWASRTKVDFQRIIALLEEVSSAINQEFDSVIQSAKEIDKSEHQKDKHAGHKSEELIKYSRDKVSTSSQDLTEFLGGTSSSLINHPFSLLVGVAGNGKTHLFADLARKLLDSNTPALLILGEKLNLGEPWSQILQILGLTCTRDEFLGSFQAAAEASNSRGIIFIDALNESENKSKWTNYLSGMVTAISKYPNIGLAISIRSTYENVIVPEHLRTNFKRLVHSGFGSQLTRAVQVYFTHYKITLPSVPLLSPEFNNPLFLGIFCRTLKNLGKTEVPEGMTGFFGIFKEYLSSINLRLSRPDILDFDPSNNLVYQFVEKFCEKIASSGQMWLPIQDAKEIAASIFSNNAESKSFYRHLLSEFLLSEDHFYTGENALQEGVRFSYERFADHFTASKIIESAKNKEDVAGRVKQIFANDKDHWIKQGLLEAISIQFPETFGQEIIEAVPELQNSRYSKEALFESLLWRSTSSVNKNTVAIVAKIANSNSHFFDKFTETLIYLAPKEGHRLNSSFLDRNLKSFKMPERDAWWSTYIHNSYTEESALGRVISWILEMDNESNEALGDSSRLQLAILLSWCFTASNRYLRDRSTKAVVRLLENHLGVAKKLFENFVNVDDLYVTERVLAACCGATTRSVDLSNLDDLATFVYNLIFKGGTPPCHLLLRDYARTIVEYSLLQNPGLKVEVSHIRPPYKSMWPSKIPSAKTIENKYGKWHDKMTEEEYGMHAIHSSVIGFGDFARYIIGTNSGNFDWTSRRLGSPINKTGKELCAEFVESLTKEQKKAWKFVELLRSNADVASRLERIRKEKSKYTAKEIKDALIETEQKFEKSLRGKKLKIYKNIIIPYLKNPNAAKFTDNFDLSIAQRFIIDRVFSLGWTKEKFGLFDRRIDRHDGSRSASKNERMGKKYQWLAYFEFLARVSDNFIFRGDTWDPKSTKYEGPWQISYCRNIDPSLLISSSKRIRYKTSATSWWSSVPFNNWSGDDNAWLKSEEILPEFEKTILVRGPDGKEWVTLDSFIEWYEPLSPEVSRYRSPQKRLWFMAKAYVLKTSDLDKFVNWGKKQNFMGRWMP